MPRQRAQPTWIPTQGDFGEVLQSQNPWRKTGDAAQVPIAWSPDRERLLAQGLWRRASNSMPRRFEVVLGQRRVGKTTVLYQTVRHLLREGVPPDRILWLRLDHPLLMRVDLGALVQPWVQSQPEKTLEAPLYLFLDELVYARDWDRWLKTFYDDHWPVQVIATSSSCAALRTARHESGVGRSEEHYLPPCSLLEALELDGAKPELPVTDRLDSTIEALLDVRVDLAPARAMRRRLMLLGGFPELLFDPASNRDEETMLLRSQAVLRPDAVERTIYKDIPQAFGVEQPMLLERLLYVLAAQVAGLLSPSNISRELGVTQPTFDRYLSYLEQSYLVFTLPNYSPREMNVQKRGRKVYFVDGAVRNAALQRGLGVLHDPGEQGHLLENMIASHLYSLAQSSGLRLYHWRDGNDEVDFVLDHPTHPIAIEVGSSASHPRTGLTRLAERHPRFAGRCWYAAPEVAQRAPTADGQPGAVLIDVLLLALGKQAELERDRRLGL